MAFIYLDINVPIRQFCWVKVGDSRDFNVWPQIVVLADIRAFVTLVDIVEKSCFTCCAQITIMDYKRVNKVGNNDKNNVQ